MIRKLLDWLFGPEDSTPRLSPDLLPRPRLHHWLKARGSSTIAWGLAEVEAKLRRRRCLQLSSHGTPSADLQEDRTGKGRVRPEIKLVKGRRTA